VKASVKGQFPLIAESVPDEELLDWLGEPLLKRIRNAEVKRVTAKTAPHINSAPRPDATPSVTRTKKKAAMSEKEYRQWVDSLKTG
jgi:hypothetical protein